MSYKFKLPEKLSFDKILERFESDFYYEKDNDSSNILDISAWAYGICTANPENPFSPGAPYNQPGCFPS